MVSKAFLKDVLDNVIKYMPWSYNYFRKYFINLHDSLPYLEENNIFTGTLSVNTISETTTGSGVTIDGVLLKDGSITTTSPVIKSVDKDVVAKAGGGKADAYQLTQEINIVKTCATALDSVKLPVAVVGQAITVANLGVAVCAVYAGGTTDTIDDVVAANYVTIPPEDVVMFRCYDAGKWQSDFESNSVYDKLYVDTILEKTAAAGVTIDGALIKDATFDTNVAAAGVTLSGTTLAADGTDGAIPITITPKGTAGILAPAGSAAVPMYSFTADPNTGIINSTADALGFVTNGVEKWLINSSGALNPILNNAYDIGNGTVNPKDIYITSGVKPIGAAFGVAGTNVTATHYGDGKDITTILTLATTAIGTVAEGAHAYGALIYTFPAGVHVHSVTYSNVGITGVGHATQPQTPVWGIGSTDATGTAAAVLNGTATLMDYITEQTAADINGTVDPTLLAATAGLMTGISLNVAGSTKTVYFNAAETWHADNIGTLTASSTVTLKWTIM